MKKGLNISPFGLFVLLFCQKQDVIVGKVRLLLCPIRFKEKLKKVNPRQKQVSVTVPKSVKLVASDVFFLSPVFDNRRKQGVCLYCVGKFKGLFTKTCEKCGRNKDY